MFSKIVLSLINLNQIIWNQMIWSGVFSSETKTEQKKNIWYKEFSSNTTILMLHRKIPTIALSRCYASSECRCYESPNPRIPESQIYDGGS